MNTCPNCGAKLSDGIFKSNALLQKYKSSLIIEFASGTSAEYCETCGISLFLKAQNALTEDLSNCQELVKKLLREIPIATIQSPINWDYEVLGLATGQSTTGTGLFSEFTSSFTDLFGLQSNAYNRKIAEGEILCSDQLRVKAMQMGGHAIVGVDIDYSELGGGKGMIMVCMSGTVVRLKNPDILGEVKHQALNSITDAANRVEYLQKRTKESRV